MPKRNKDHLISFSALIEITCEKYPEFKEMVDCSDAEIFSTIPYLIVLKSSLDTGKEATIAREICERFYPQLKESQKYEQLTSDFDELRKLAGESFFSFYNKIESQILLGEKTPDQILCGAKIDKLPENEQSKWRLLHSQVQTIKEIGMNLTRQMPTEWNEFMTVALGVE